MKTLKRNQESIPDNRKFNMIVILIYFTFLFILEFTVFRPFLKPASINFLTNAKTNLFFLAMNDIFITLSYLLCSKWIFIFICMLILNFSTVYKLFIFTQNIFIGCFVISLFQLIIKDELVYYNESVLFPIKTCVTFFGTPSISATLSTIGVFTLRHLFFLEGFLSKWRRAYLVSFIICILYIVFAGLIGLFSIVNSLDQIIFGIFLGFGIYFFVFYIFKIQAEKGRQLLTFIKKNFLLHFILTFFPLVLLTMTYIVFRTSDKLLAELGEKLSKCKCPATAESPLYFREAKFSLIFGSFILINYVIIFSLKLEYSTVFPRRDNDWMHYNFNNDVKSILEESFCSDISIGEKETRWNKTGILFSLIRLAITFLVCFGILLLFEFYELETENVTFYLLCNSFSPLALVFFFLFYFSKVLFRILHLSNECVIILSG